MYLDAATPLNEVFPDPAFAQVIATLLGISDVTTPITQAQLDTITGIRATGIGINSIEGLQYIHNMTTALLYTNNISDLSPLNDWVSPYMVNLQLQQNPISDIGPIARMNLPKLSVLALNQCNLDNDDLLMVASINSRVLWQLTLSGNHITDFSPLGSAMYYGRLSRTWLQDQFIDLPIKVVEVDEPFSITVDAIDHLGTSLKINQGATFVDSTLSDDAKTISWDTPPTRDASMQIYSVSSSPLVGSISYIPTIFYTQPLTYVPYFETYDEIVQVVKGDNINILDGMVASDVEDGNISTSITTSGEVDTTTLGTYEISYAVSDSDGYTSKTKTRKYVVVDEITTDKYIIFANDIAKCEDEVSGTNDELLSLSNVYSSKLIVTIPSDGTIKILDNGGYDGSVGTYQVTFGIEEDATVTKTIDVTITEIPEEPGIPEKPITSNKATQASTAVQTADTTNIATYVVVLMFAGAILLVMKKRQINK